MKLFIKNMVCIRCKIVVKSELQKLGLGYTFLEMGEVELDDMMLPQTHECLKIALHQSGLELIYDNKAILIEKTKNLIVQMIHSNEDLPKMKFSCYLSEKLHYNYTYISNLFSEVKGVTIEHFIIAHKIERVKDLLIYNELSLSAIADKLLYRNVTYLSRQFKKVTGVTPSYFKKMNGKEFISLESL